MCFARQRRALFRLATSKSGPKLVCFVHFDFEMCFAPQRRALFWHLNFQKWSGAGVFCTFWLRNVLRATTACHFSSLIWPDGSAPAALASLLFDPPEPQIIGNHSVSRLSYLFAHLHLLSSDSTLSLLWSSLFYSSLLSDSSHLCFLSVNIVGSLTSKLPSTTLYYEASTKHVPVLLCTTKIYEACTKHVPVLLCTTKLAQSTFQYYFVLPSSQKGLPSTTLYYKACTKHVPVLLCTTKLAKTNLGHQWHGHCKKCGHCRLNFLHQFCPSPEGAQQNVLGSHQV